MKSIKENVESVLASFSLEGEKPSSYILELLQKYQNKENESNFNGFIIEKLSNLYADLDHLHPF